MPRYENFSEILTLEDGLFNLVFTEFNLFNLSRHIIDGHVLVSLIQSHCKLNNIDITSVELDPESDLFSAYSDDYQLLKKLQFILKKLIDDDKALNRSLKYSTVNTIDDLSTKELLALLREDSTDPATFEFTIDFLNIDQAQQASEACSKMGFLCTLNNIDSDIYLQLKMTVSPVEEEFTKIEQTIKKIARQYKGTYEYFCVVFNEPFEIS